jgi:hypothetical protein
MVKFAHDLDLVDEGFLAIVLSVSGVLGEGLNCIFFAIFVADHQIDRCEIALTNLLDWLEQLMEASLVYLCLEESSPGHQFLDIVSGFEDKGFAEALEFKCFWLLIHLGGFFMWILPEQLEDEVEAELDSKQFSLLLFLTLPRSTWQTSTMQLS